MKISLQKSEFMKRFLPTLGTVSNKNTISSIEGVLIETLDDGTVRLSTYDMNKGVRAILRDVKIDRPGSYIINAQRLSQTVRVLPDDEMTIEVDDKCSCTVSSGKSSFSMFCLKGEEFPNLPDLTTDRGFTVSSGVLKKMIGKVSHSIADQDTRPMLCGAFFRILPGRMEVVSCDSYTLSVCKKSCEIGKISDTDVDYSFIIPGHALNELNKILSDSEEDSCEVFLSRKHAIIRAEDTVFFTRTIDSEYIDYYRLMPKENDIAVVIDRERLLEGLERANIIAEEKIQGSGKSFVKITVEDQILTLSSSSVNGNVSDEMDCVHDGRDIEIGFNCRYLINSVKASEGEAIKIKLKSPTQSITIEPAEEDEDSSFFYMILPVRMNG